MYMSPSKPSSGGASQLSWGSEDHLTALEDCLQSAGYRTSVDAVDGQIVVLNPGDVADPVDVCQRDLQNAGLIDASGPAGEADYRRWFAAYEQINACLADHGYPHEPMPAWDEFVEGSGMWHPWHAAMGTSESKEILWSRHGGPEAAFAALDATCPQDFEAWE